MGLNRKYVGDGYAICSDLPAQHFLAQGSTYQLLDSPAPELHVDPIEWRSETPLTLDPTSQLYAKLSAEVPKLKIVLDQTLACTGIECSINAIRTLKVGGIYYEYIRTPCVNKAFYDEARTIVRRENGDNAMCADPLMASATAACCGDSATWSEAVSSVEPRCGRCCCFLSLFLLMPHLHTGSSSSVSGCCSRPLPTGASRICVGLISNQPVSAISVWATTTIGYQAHAHKKQKLTR